MNPPSRNTARQTLPSKGRQPAQGVREFAAEWRLLGGSQIFSLHLLLPINNPSVTLGAEVTLFAKHWFLRGRACGLACLTESSQPSDSPGHSSQTNEKPLRKYAWIDIWGSTSRVCRATVFAAPSAATREIHYG